MTIEHTPAPWTAQTCEGSYGYEVTVPIDFGIGRKPIAIALYDTSKNIAQANASLIAAAPDLLLTLETIEAATFGLKNGLAVEINRAANKAIKKARGGQ